MKILLISGHGAGDPGAVSTVGGKAYREAEETRQLATDVSAALSGAAHVDIYPTERNAFIDYGDGVLGSAARFSQYDYVLEIHFNAYRYDPGNGVTKGVECYVTTEEKTLGVEEAICRNISALGFINRGVKRKNWAVIKTAKNAGVSSALLEVCFIDDADDMKIYEANRKKVAAAIAEGVMEGFGLKKNEAPGAREWVQVKAGLTDETMNYLADYKYGDELLEKLAAVMK